MGEGLRTPAARLRTRVSERLKDLGFNLLGYGTSWPNSFNLSRQLQRPMRLKKTPQSGTTQIIAALTEDVAAASSSARQQTGAFSLALFFRDNCFANTCSKKIRPVRGSILFG